MKTITLLLALMLATSVSASYVPREAMQYKRFAVATYRQVYGAQAPIAMLAAQIHQESAWNCNARSRVGAEGCAQFLKSTAKWISSVYPQLGAANPFDYRWSIRAQALFMKRLEDQNTADSDCDDAAFALAAYNGGRGHILREKQLAREAGDPPNTWWNSVEKHCDRSPANCRENREYPKRIIHEHQSLYRHWQGGRLVCGV